MTGLHWVLALHPDEERVLRAMRESRDTPRWRCVDVAREADLPYRRAWAALQRLHSRGYCRRDLSAHWWPEWRAVVLPHRAQVSLEVIDNEP